MSAWRELGELARETDWPRLIFKVAAFARELRGDGDNIARDGQVARRMADAILDALARAGIGQVHVDGVRCICPGCRQRTAAEDPSREG